jgi:SOS response regulatory protein OraA/RecX
MMDDENDALDGELDDDDLDESADGELEDDDQDESVDFEADEQDEKLAKRSRERAIRKAMDYLSIRDHSRYELMKKLTRCEFSVEDIIAAITHAEEGGWLVPPDVMAEKVADQLHRKKKSHLYILGYLKQKKLPSVRRDQGIELEKARKLVQSRFSRLSKRFQGDKKEVRKQIAQFLRGRGFDSETIAKVSHEASGDSKSVYRTL